MAPSEDGMSAAHRNSSEADTFLQSLGRKQRSWSKLKLLSVVIG